MSETDAFGQISNKALTLIRSQEQDWLSAWLSQNVIEESLIEMKCEVCGGNLFRGRKSTLPLSFWKGDTDTESLEEETNLSIKQEEEEIEVAETPDEPAKSDENTEVVKMSAKLAEGFYWGFWYY